MIDAIWRDRLDAVALASGLATSDHPRLATWVRDLSDQYNRAAFPVRWTPERIAARLHFFLPRDAMKVATALRDVPLPAGDGPVEVHDVGAGIGASALGVVLGLRARGLSRPMRLQLSDTHAAPLDLAGRVLRGLPGVELDTKLSRPEIVVYSNVLAEVDHGRPEPARIEAHARMLRAQAAGLVLVVEPALRDCARRLQAVRDRLVAAGVPVLAPCTHDAPCPMLRRDTDWCHDDLPVDLPPWLHPVARAAGLRWQGLTYARLVLGEAPAPRPAFRVVAPPRDSRGRKERLLCGSLDGDVLTWVDRLDKHASQQNGAWDDLARGDGLDLSPAERRVGRETVVTRTG
ncbi:MAG: hypothetical protein FJ090_18090 [Deltaproteobacteria bacterium]|nr:hypothetical protein [Deltaproteobacteria bacterium]